MIRLAYIFVALLLVVGVSFSQLYQGPATGSIPNGATVNTGSFGVYGKPEFGGPLEKRVHNKIQVQPMPPMPNMPPPTGPEGSNYFEDLSVSTENTPPPPITIASFAGIPQTNSIPPDPHLAVGPNHVIQVVNTSFRISDKNGNTLKTISANSWYASTLAGASPFDPKVHYDHHAGRWIQVWLNVNDAAQTAHFLISVSDDSDPLGVWYNWALPSHTNGNANAGNWADYQGVGFDRDGLYFTSNQFTFALSFAYTKLRIIGKAQLYANTAGAVTWSDLWNIRDNFGNSSFGVRPAVVFTAPNEYYLLNIPNFTSGTYFVLYRLTNAFTSPALTATHIPVVAWTIAPNANQLGGGMLLEGGRSQLRNEPSYRDSIIWGVHSVASGSFNQYSSVRYVRINTVTNSTVEDAALGAEGFWHTYPALMADKDKNVAVTYSRTGLTEYIGAYMSWRLVSDPPGLRPTVTIQAGKANYVKDFGSGRNRWGDYLGIALDPADQNNIWMLPEYAESPAHTWGVWVHCTRLVPLPGRRVAVNFPSLDFGDKEVGLRPDTLSLKISSVGSSSLTVNSITNSNSAFSLIGLPSFPRTMAAYDSINIRIVFNPTTHGVITDSISIASNDSLSATIKVQLRGKGFIIGRSLPGTIYAVSGGPTNQLFSVHGGTGVPTVLGPTSVSEIQTLTIRPTSKELYGTSTTGANTAIYRISAQYGDALFMRTLPVQNMRAIAFTRGDTLYGATMTGRLYRINLQTGDSVFVGSSTGISYSGLAFSPTTGRLWASVRPAITGRDRIYTVNLVTGETTLIGSTGFGAVTPGLAFSAQGVLYGATGTGTQTNNFILIDTLTAVGTLIGSMNTSGITGIALRSDSGLVSVPDLVSGEIPREFALNQNYPNPFNPNTSVRFDLPELAHVTLRIFNVLGQEVRTLVSADKAAGSYEVEWDGTWANGIAASSGVYFCKLEAIGKSKAFGQMRKMLLLK